MSLNVVIPRPPASIEETELFRRIAASSPDIDGLHAKAKRFIEVANPIVDSIIAGPFRSYTLHNRDHARKLVHLADCILSRDTLNGLTAFECLLIVYVSYLHDMGLSVTDDEVARYLGSDEFQDSLANWPNIAAALAELRDRLLTADLKEKTLLEVEIADVHSVALTNFLRPRHATHARYKALCAQIRHVLSGEDPFQIRGVSFEDELIELCVSHNLEASVLGEIKNAHEDRFPRRFVAADHIANLQFIGGVLRLADILDFDFERTPRVLFESLGLRNRTLPGADVTLREWEKHLAVQQLEIRESELVVNAHASHPAIEAAVRQFCEMIEREIRETLSVVRRNPENITERYRFRLPTSVRAEVRSKGYKYIDLALKLDEAAVMTLLMGTKLYPTKYAAVREGVQNAVDACVIRQRIRPDLGQPQVHVFVQQDIEERHWLCIQDDGIGMNEHVLRDYFFRVGRSYYTSIDFERLLRSANILKLPLVSRFGIGFLASFMLADLIEIETRPVPVSVHLPREIGHRVSVERLGALAYVQEADLPEGTTIKLRLKKSFEDIDSVIKAVDDFIHANILRPGVPITVTLPGRSRQIVPNEYYELRKTRFTREGLPKDSIEGVQIDLAKFSKTFSGRAFLFFVRDPTTDALDIRYEDRLLWVGTGPSLGRITIDPSWVLQDFAGNRVTVGGFRMVLSQLARLLRSKSNSIAAVYDFDVTPGPDVAFDVARSRIIDDNTALRTELKHSIERGLREVGIWRRISSRAQELLTYAEPQSPFRLSMSKLKDAKRIEDETLLSQVQKLVPFGSWPAGLHRDIAMQLGISNRKSFNALYTLISEGRIRPPKVRQPVDQ